MLRPASTNDVLRVAQLLIDPAVVGQGLGSTLLAHALNTLARPIRLYTFQANSGARRFYERHGFLAIQFTDGQGNEERCPDVLYELGAAPSLASLGVWRLDSL